MTSKKHGIRLAAVQVRNDSLTEANADLAAFSRSMAHDLKAPVRHLLFHADVLLRDHKDSMSPQALNYVLRMKASASHMAHLVSDLLEWFTITRRPLGTTVVALEPLVRSVIAEFAAETQDRDVEWRVSSLFDLPCDRGLLLISFRT